MNSRLIACLAMATFLFAVSACSGMSTRDKNTAAGAATGRAAA